MSDTDAWNTRPADAAADAPAPAAETGADAREASPAAAAARDERRRSASPGRGGRMDVDSREGGRSYDRNDGGRDNPGNNLHVSSLSVRVDQRELEALFGKYGVIDKVQIMFDPHSRESRGFGFVTMTTAEEADAAIDALNNTELQGKVMRVEKARRGRARTPTPGRYFGPPREDFPPRGPPPRAYRDDRYERPYDPKPYDSRYAADDRRGGGGDYDYYGAYDRYRRYDDRPPPSRYDDRPPPSRYDDRPPPRRYDDRPPPSRYDDRPAYDDRYGAPRGGPPPPRRDDTYTQPAAYGAPPPRGDDRRY